MTAPRGAGRSAAALRAIVRATLAGVARTPGEIAIVLTDDATLRALNRDWRGIDRATDVISFAYDERGPGETLRPRRPLGAAAGPGGARRRGVGAASRRTPGPELLADGERSTRVNGDLVVSLDRMREQAKRFRVREGAELARLVIHGVLHLAGWDHQRAAERRDMRAQEDAALRACAAAVRMLDGDTR